MEKISSKDEVAARLKEKEQAIHEHFEALQKEVVDTGGDIRDFFEKNAWVGVVGAIAAGVLVGWIIGKKDRKALHRELVDDYLDKLAELARQSGADDREVGVILRDALRETMPPVVFSAPQREKGGLARMLMSVGADMAVGFAKKTLINILDDKLKPKSNPDLPDIADREG